MFASLPYLHVRAALHELLAFLVELFTLGEVQLPPPVPPARAVRPARASLDRAHPSEASERRRAARTGRRTARRSPRRSRPRLFPGNRRLIARGDRPVSSWPPGRVLLLWPELDRALEGPHAGPASPSVRTPSPRRRDHPRRRVTAPANARSRRAGPNLTAPAMGMRRHDLPARVRARRPTHAQSHGVARPGGAERRRVSRGARAPSRHRP